MIEGAGGVIWRLGNDMRVEIVVVHRPHRDDWSLPKGKRHRNESAVHCALREVREETGLRCRLGQELASAHYLDRKGRPKRVRYWAMQRVDGRFASNREVDEMQWVAVDHVDQVLTHAHDMTIVAGLQLVHAIVA